MTGSQLINLSGLEDGRDTGYILEVDLKFAQKLHDRHFDYPLALVVTEDMLSPHSKQLLKNLDMFFLEKLKNLVPNWLNKTKYILHFRNLNYSKLRKFS